jgi:hypothetical protein
MLPANHLEYTDDPAYIAYEALCSKIVYMLIVCVLH